MAELPPWARSLWGHLLVLVVWGTTFYALVIYPFQLNDIVIGFFIASSGMALQWEFGTAIAGQTARQQANATKTGTDAGANPDRGGGT